MPEPESSSAKTTARPCVGPWLLDFLARRIAFPTYCGITSFDAATEDFREETRQIEQVCGQFSPDDFVHRVSVPPRLGLDDAERTWSAAMVVEHLIAAGDAVGQTLVFLSRGQPSPVDFSAHALRPRGGRGVAVMTDFRAFASAYPRTITRELGDRTSVQTHAHPWLGELGVHDWHCFAVLHLRAHRRQLAEIRRRVSNEARSGRLPAVLFDPAPEPNSPP